MISIPVEADLPDGVVNLLQGQGTEMGSAMVAESGTIAERLKRRLGSVTPAPLVNDAARRNTMAVTQSWMTAEHAELIAGSLVVPDDRTHRMGWFLPPAMSRDAVSPSRQDTGTPSGPIVTWSVCDHDPTIGPTDGGASPASLPAAVHTVVGADLEARVASGELTAGWYDREAL